MHAATSEYEEQGFFDGLRARLVQLLLDSNLGKKVSLDHPNLLKNIITFTNKFIGEKYFQSVSIAHSEQLSIQRADGISEPWDGLSSGEQSAFSLAMAIEFERKEKSQIILFEEPENYTHPIIQKYFLKKLKTLLNDRQVFIGTHSPYLFKDYLGKAKLIITKRQNKKIVFKNTDDFFGLFSKPSWGEISYYAYGLLTFEFHNELYGWIQEKKQKPYLTGKNGIDNFFKTQGCQIKNWIEIDKKTGKQKAPAPQTLMTYIRNFIHHPENIKNQKYSEKELKQSISTMIKIIKTLRNKKSLVSIK
jgi:hypothetical protein